MDQKKHHVPKGGFQNLSDTPQLAEGYSMLGVMKDFFFSKPAGIVPPSSLPHVKTDLKSYHSAKPSIIWFGHSSYLIHADGVNILVDPVFSGHASPSRLYIKAFKGADIYKPDDMPDIDALIITHNHYDHLDIGTVRSLAPKVKRFYMPLGVGKSLKGVSPGRNQALRELDWWEKTEVLEDIELIATPARHFSGRGLKRNGSLWASFVLTIKEYKIFIGSDSGYDSHFREIGERYGPFDIALLECGQYNTAWPFKHSMPEELRTEATALKAQVVWPVHWGPFALALHDWNEPVERFVKAADAAKVSYTTPMIGQPVVLDEYYPKERWWEGV